MNEKNKQTSIMNKQKKEIISNNICILLLTIVFLLLNVLIVMTTREKFDIKLLNRYSLLIDNMPGFISMVQVVVCIVLVGIDYKKGTITGIALLCFSGIGALMAALRGPQSTAILGTFMSVVGIFVVLLLHRQFRVIKNNEKVLEQQAVTDSLTGLMNRRGAFRFLNQMIADRKSFYLLFLDLDNFKEINDTLGHKVGDYLLQTISDRWGKLVRPNGMVARNGGDEFLIVLPDDGEVDVEEYMQELIDVLGDEIYLDGTGNVYHASVSIGSSHFPNDGNDAEELMKYADMAMYEAKTMGKKRYCTFSAQMKQDMERDLELEMYLRKALKEDLFTLAFQPQYTTGDKKLRGFETLLRLNDESGAPISPAEFIPVAEHSTLIIDIDEYVLKKALGMCRKLVEETGRSLTISVNVSAKHMVRNNFVDDIDNILKEIDFPASCLELELTEYCYVQSVEQAIRTISRLNELGVRIALDDFGTGYASLSYLSRMPMDVLKIDKSFVDNLGKDKESKDFIDAIISMGHTLGCRIVSEGVETEEQLALLRNSDCDYIQGYVWSKPISFEEACKLVG